MQFDVLNARDDGHEWSVRNTAHRKVATVIGPKAAEHATLFATAPELLEALRRLVDEQGFVSDATSCECGENGTGFDDDGNPCEHIQARRALAKATP